MRKRILVLPLAVCLAAGAGCGNSTGLYPVSGTVLSDGKPAVGATVSFLKKGGDPATDGPSMGVVGEDGTFTLAGPAGEGAAPGEYAVLVEWKEGAGKQKGRSPGLGAPDRLKERYLNPANPLLSATVEAKTNVLPPFDVK